jgi:predicted dehydrogenase
MPSINKVLDVIKEGSIGPIKYIRADFGFEAPYKPEGRLFDTKLGGGSLLDVGIYPLFLATLLLGEPTIIHSVGKLAETGADEYAHAIFQYPGGETASIFSSITIRSSLTAEITGSEGRIYLHNPFYKTNKITVYVKDEEPKDYSFPYDHNGFEYQVRHVTDCLDKNLRESPLIPLDLSLLMSRTMDEIRKQLGVNY